MSPACGSSPWCPGNPVAPRAPYAGTYPLWTFGDVGFMVGHFAAWEQIQRGGARRVRPGGLRGGDRADPAGRCGAVLRGAHEETQHQVTEAFDELVDLAWTKTHEDEEQTLETMERNGMTIANPIQQLSRPPVRASARSCSTTGSNAPVSRAEAPHPAGQVTDDTRGVAERDQYDL